MYFGETHVTHSTARCMCTECPYSTKVEINVCTPSGYAHLPIIIYWVEFIYYLFRPNFSPCYYQLYSMSSFSNRHSSLIHRSIGLLYKNKIEQMFSWNSALMCWNKEMNRKEFVFDIKFCQSYRLNTPHWTTFIYWINDWINALLF